jgi:integrase/recombinase XerD
MNLPSWEQFSDWLFKDEDQNISQYNNYHGRYTFITHFFKDKKLTLDTAKEFRRYVGSLNKSPSTKNLILQTLRYICEYLGSNIKLYIHNFKNYKTPKIPLDADEQKRLVDEAYKSNYRYALACEVMERTGMRIDELAEITHDDMYGDVIIIRGEISKNRQGREIYLDPDLVEKIKRLPFNKKSNLIFAGAYGGKLNEDLLNSFLQEVARKVNIVKPVTNHILRHSFASSLYENGIDIKTIQELLGHKCIETTKNYVHLSSKLKKKAMRKHPLSKMYRVTDDVIDDFRDYMEQYRDTVFYPILQEVSAFMVYKLNNIKSS